MVKSIENFKSALVCAMVGDSMGWVTEFQSKWFKDNVTLPVTTFMDWKRKTGGRWYGHYENVEKGEYSDDTQLMLATLRSLQYSNWFDYLAMVEFPLWTLYARGAGRACKNSASILSTSKYCWESKGKKLECYYSSGGNGGVMRILPHLFDSKEDRSDFLCMALANSLLTHGHSNSIIGTLLYADALHCIYRGIEKDKLIDEILNNGLPHYIEYLDKTLSMLEQCGFMVLGQFIKNSEDIEKLIYMTDKLLKDIPSLLESQDTYDEIFAHLGITSINRGSDLSNALASIFLYLKHDAPYDAIYHCTNTLSCDTDTLASMSGALLGLDCTLDDLPEWFKSVADYDVALNLLDKLENNEKCSVPLAYVKPDRVKDYLFSSYSITEINLVGAGSLTVENTVNLEVLMYNIEVVQKVIRREDGQRIFIKKIKRV